MGAETVISLREKQEAVLREWGKKLIDPMIAEGRAAGLTDADINLAINRALFDAFQGLHRFPPSHRP